MAQVQKVLHVVAGSGKGGAETFCLDAIKALHDAGIKQHIICRAHPHYLAAFRERGIPYDTLSFSWLSRLFNGPYLIRKRVKSFEPDLVHAWMGRAASFIPAKLPVPVLGWFGGYYGLKRYRTSDCYMGVTRDIGRHLIEKSKTPDRCFVVHTFGTLEPSPPVSKANFNTPEEAPVVLLLSRMHWKKGVDTLLKAAQKLEGVYFWLAGDGPDMEKYKALCHELGLDERVRFLGWRHDRASLLEKATVCTLPSRYEPFGTVIAESWFSGIPLVAAKAAGASQYVTHDFDGLLCEIDDVDGLAEQLRRALQDHDLRTRLIENGKTTYQTLFSRNVVVKSLIEAYEKIIALGKK
ncbi:MAG: glycosyltransferase [Alphaproteobacteria bacterium]|jgi:glycosyltransferase involved in cell wall biosynthesis|nr:glycosyltransferase [Alphaproteobacteria bacterium]